MTHKRNTLAVLLIVCVVGLVGIYFAGGSGQAKAEAQSKPQPQKSPKSWSEQVARETENYPVVDLNDVRPFSPEELELHNKRGQKYKSDIAAFKEEWGDTFELPPSQTYPALPVDRSDAIITGRVSDAQAFLTAERNVVFTEFTVQVENTFKGSTDSTIVAERIGGKVRFPSGKILTRGSVGRFPSVNDEVILFLKRDETGKSYSIITGYRIIDAKVFPLDGYNPGTDQKLVAGYKEWRGKEQQAFVAKLNEAIKKASKEVSK
jgi:hypothetical protein